MYGHSPFFINRKRHRQKISTTFKENIIKDEGFLNSINQIYFRTKAVNDYIPELIKIDANSLIIIIGDHLPKIYNFNKYGYLDNNKKKLLNYYVIYKGVPIKVDKTIHHHNIPDLILNILSNKKIDPQKNSIKKYNKIIYQSIN
jgi:hypothetical protein